ncbi:SDR family oxidoreductase [Adhaeribacter rhizoryzae]|uniref:SDR family oxidoreductase n=1 Tax=Adhaeribacter rhizoryzae TaxID=2607907 RepID=A0A5M6DKG3_9BACT|nr:SDR family oxidoreductase [Adhaeribacter rhizoryzae]KAA5547978.1 SDR family oxidoreductase [Adhaeribacter rhizoryzae]
MAKENKISILGCGWLGLPVAEHLLASGYEVHGSTTTPAKLDYLREKKIKAYLIDLAYNPPSENLPAFLETDILIISFPPGLRAGNGVKYLEQIVILNQHLRTAAVQKILFISSTSVYPDLKRVVTETEDLRPYLPDNILLQAENLLTSSENKKVSILRMGGLVGGTRQAGRFLAGKQNIPNPEAPVNLIHQEDCVGIISAIIEKNKWGEIFNGCADEHPSRMSFYTAAAQKLNLPAPHFAPASPADGFKIISNEKVKNLLSYVFKHPDPMLFL